MARPARTQRSLANRYERLTRWRHKGLFDVILDRLQLKMNAEELMDPAFDSKDYHTLDESQANERKFASSGLPKFKESTESSRGAGLAHVIIGGVEATRRPR